ncbi:hypothetical protein [Actinoplanes sp. HUAS TT8]|uniref:hypothetical protein n=1 Tax=Actinoplanes sp. HUAS TT8 TaxID=3447453 RepID=UPI003F521A25
MTAEELADQMDHSGSLIRRECVTCGTTSEWSLAMQPRTRRGEDPAVNTCGTCLAAPLAEEQTALFAAYNLRRIHDGYAAYGMKVAAHCLSCGAERLISATDLLRGVAPCLRCVTPVDPEAPYFVYLMHFPRLRAFKVGITNSETRSCRISAHAAHGGNLIEMHEVSNGVSARTVEDAALELVREFPSGCGPRDFPQGGHTETWGEEGGYIDLKDIIADLERRRAPGFDLIHQLTEYFAEEPVTIAELRDFTQITVEEFDGVQVHRVDLSMPQEQMLRRIRAQRNIAPSS